MSAKAKKQTKPEAEKFPRKTIPLAVTQEDGEPEITRKQTALCTSPEIAALRVMRGVESKTSFWDNIDVPFLVDQLREQSAAVSRNDLAQVESMLINQATALQSIFVRLVERGMSCSSLNQYEADMRIALRAQSQCRATLETLAAIKNPPVIYAKQANVTSGPQQINNGMAAPSQAEEKEIGPNKLLEAQHGNYVDNGKAGKASGVNSQLATVGEIDRAEVGGRKSAGFAER